MKSLQTYHPAFWGFAAGSAILAYEPIKWLIGTWRDPSYQSSGALYLIVLGGLLLWSLTSPRYEHHRSTQIMALGLLCLAAFLRLISQVAAINIIGGVALALDIFALLTFLGVAHRSRPVSPFWVSVLFLFTLPFERIAQRILGYPLQEISAFGACQMLSAFFDDLVCAGTRLTVSGKDVLVDLPCSGTSGLMISLAVIVSMNALFRPSFLKALLIAMTAAALAVVANALRITLLAIGLAFEDQTGINVMAQPLHDIIGYFTLFIGLAPVLAVHKPTSKIDIRAEIQLLQNNADNGAQSTQPNAVTTCLAIVFVGAALIVVSLPRQALDVSRTLSKAHLPLALNGHVGRTLPLMDIERAYFEHYGGTAQKAIYGPMALTLVQTTSPLRHLHDPADCLRGLGYEVTFIGTRFEPAPTALYRAEDADGVAWNVAVTFTNDAGFATASVAEAVWHWLKTPGHEWRSIQRITPWTADETTKNQFEWAAAAAFDLTSHLGKLTQKRR